MGKNIEKVEVRFILNKSNYKDKLIIQLLESQYDTNSFIKSELYKMAINNKTEEDVNFKEAFNPTNNKMDNNDSNIQLTNDDYNKVEDDIIANNSEERTADLSSFM